MLFCSQVFLVLSLLGWQLDLRPVLDRCVVEVFLDNRGRDQARVLCFSAKARREEQALVIVFFERHQIVVDKSIALQQTK